MRRGGGDSLQACQNPEEILRLASRLGYKLTFKALLAHIWKLEADHWPWAQTGRRWRLAFFSQHVHQSRSHAVPAAMLSCAV